MEHSLYTLQESNAHALLIYVPSMYTYTYYINAMHIENEVNISVIGTETSRASYILLVAEQAL